MDPLENSRTVAKEIISLAQKQGVDLEQFCDDDFFIKDRRWIWFWRKDELPGTGPANEPLGTLHYNMQGAISGVPNKLKESADLLPGQWTEAGTFDNVEQAFALLKAWLLDGKEVDDLPHRSVKSYGILSGRSRGVPVPK